MPQNEPGRIVEPTVCEPSASGTMKSATAAADPAESDPITIIRGGQRRSVASGEAFALGRLDLVENGGDTAITPRGRRSLRSTFRS